MPSEQVDKKILALVETSDGTGFTTVGQLTIKELNIRRNQIDPCNIKVDRLRESNTRVTHVAVITCEDTPNLNLKLRAVQGKTIDIIGYFTGQLSTNQDIP